MAALVVQKDVLTMSEIDRQFDNDRPWPSILVDRRIRWLEALEKGAVVRDRFQLRDKTAVARLRPSDVTIKPAFELEMDRFLRRVDEMSYQLEGVSPGTPVQVEPWPSNYPRTFYGCAFLLAPGVPDPPDDDTWGYGPGRSKSSREGLEHDGSYPGQSWFTSAVRQTPRPGKPLANRGTQMARTVLHIVPGGGRWAVKLEGLSWNLALLETKQPAIDHAKSYARQHQPSQIILHNADGTIATEWTYGSDPYPPEG
jgi:hypothetical protein